ncbi:hypothetical protein EDB83DRAFT_2319126 [Lactarius deliciosus]|nr:hypothetical protein EDB83DRAFT_2319126 [Lactarius deliciosus]
MFSDPIDSSDAQSFDEDDMYGSDSNVETISLQPDSVEPFSDNTSSTNEGVEEAGLVSETEELCTDLREVLLMVRALCETEGIDVSDISQVTSETQDGQYQGHSPHTSEIISKVVQVTIRERIHITPTTFVHILLTSYTSVIMPRKNNFSIPMGDVTEVVSKTKKSKRGLRTTIEEVPFHSSKQKQSGQASRQAKVVEAQSSHPTQVMHESDTLQLIEPYETDVHDIQTEDTQPQLHGVQAAQELQSIRRRPRRNQSASLISVEENAPLSEDLHPRLSQEFEGVFEMEVLFCVCPNAGTNDEQRLQAGMFPSTFRHIETTFTFSVLDDFLADNLECKTTAQQYYSKLQSITNRMFPDNVPAYCFPTGAAQWNILEGSKYISQWE